MPTDLLARYSSCALEAEVRWATWELTVFEVTFSNADPIYVAVRRGCLGGFLDGLWSGALDAELTAAAASPSVRRRSLGDGDSVAGVLIAGSVTDPSSLPPAERDRSTGRIGGQPPRGRRDKQRSEESDPPRSRSSRPRVPRSWVVAGVAGAVLVGAVGVAVAGGGSGPEQALVPVTTSTLLQPFGPPDTVVAPPVTFPERFSGQYEVTTVIESVAETPDVVPHYGFSPGQSHTVQLHCGSIETDSGNTVCSPDLTGVGVDDYLPMMSFSVDDMLETGSGRTVQPGAPCTGDSSAIYEPERTVEMTGYGTDTISGRYSHRYDQLYCELQSGGYYLVFDVVLSFTGRLVG